MTADVATELLPAPVVSLGVEAESWLQDLTASSPDQPIVWCPHGYRRSGTAVPPETTRSRAGAARPSTSSCGSRTPLQT